MKLDAKLLRYLSNEEFRVLTAVEMGSKNHEVVPTTLIANIAQLKTGGTYKILGTLAKNNLIARVQNAKYDGYRLTYGGYDYLALHTFASRGTIHSVGNQIGVGKESDIYIVADKDGNQHVLKIHRLGRTSFRAIKTKRDYLETRKSASWMYMSRLAATKEFAFMKALYEHKFPVPVPIDQNRHCIIMSLVDGFLLSHIANVAVVEKLYMDLMGLVLRLAKYGLIHGDFNEFNLLVKEIDQSPVLIDFPQMVSTSHANAPDQFARDVKCIKDFFQRRFHYVAEWWPTFEDLESTQGLDLDRSIRASGALKLTKKQIAELDAFLELERQHSVLDSLGISDEDEEQEQENSVINLLNSISLTHTDDHLLQSIASTDCTDLPLMTSNHSFKPFRDSDLLAYRSIQGIAASEQVLELDPDDGSSSATPITESVRLVRQKRVLTKDQIKQRVAKSQSHNHTRDSQRNSNKARTRKDRAAKDLAYDY